MRRTPLLLLVVLGCPIVGITIWLAAQSQADPARIRPIESTNASHVPLTRILMFNSGVGHFEREGIVEGSPRVDLSFPFSDINDLLKSLTVDDDGKPGVVSYDNTDPNENLSSFAMNLATNPTFGQLLNQARGEKVEVSLEGGAAGNGPFAGTIVGMEATQETSTKEVHHLNILTGDGVRRLPLERIARFRFLNAAFEEEFRRGLTGLTTSQNSQRRNLSLHLRGDGTRKLKIGYVVDNPIWKSCYRLALEGKDGKPHLQWWAVVQNTTDEDWKDVRVVLVSGRPISFTMDLAQTLFMPRPPVTPEVYASLQPPTHASAALGGPVMMGGLQGGLQGGFQGGMGGPRWPTPPTDFDDKGRGIGGDSGNLNLFNRYQIDLGRKPTAPARLSYEELMSRRNVAVNDARTAAARISNDAVLEAIAVDAGRIGEGFRLLVDQTVSLPRRKSALLPVQHGPITLTPVSIYNRATHPRFPLRGAKIKNTTGQHLLAGPATVTDAEGYVGDCKLPNLQPNEERYISFSMDLGLEVTPAQPVSHSEYGPFSIHRGELSRNCKTTIRSKYRLNNRSSKPRTLLLDHARDSGGEAVDRHGSIDAARSVRRLEWRVAANKVIDETVTEEVFSAAPVLLSSLDDKNLTSVAESATTPRSVKDALLKVVAFRARVSASSDEVGRLGARIKAILEEQERLGTNIERLPNGSAAHKRLLEKFDALEVELEQARDTSKAKTEAHIFLEKEFETFLRKLEAE